MGLTWQAKTAIGTLAIVPAMAQAQIATPAAVAQTSPGASVNASLTPHTSEQAQTPSEAVRDTSGIQDIIVTAERREARLQQVPIAITAATAEQLTQRGVSDAFDIGKITPSFNSNRTVGFGSPIMRGVGTTSVGAGDEPSVATYVDGFYQGSSISAQIPFNNITRIEVLKGPQGTLYGRNATGGLVSIITRDPSDDLEVEGSVGYGNYNTLTANGYVSGRLLSGVAASLSATYRDQGDGYSDILGSEATVGRAEYIAVRGKLRFDLGGNSELVLGGEYVDSKDNRANVNIPFPGTTPLTAGPGVVFATRPYTWVGSLLPKFTVEQWGVNAKLAIDLGGATLTSLTQYKEITNRNDVEGDGTTANGIIGGVQLGVTPGLPDGSPLTPQLVVPLTFAYTVLQKQPYFFTQELQLTSSGDGPFSWIIGGYFQSSKDAYDPLNIYFDVSDLNVPFTSIVANEMTRALAAFAQTTYKFDNGISITGGLRYSSEKKHVVGTTTVPAFAIVSSADQEETFNSVTYRVALDYQVSRKLLLYATTNKGFKSGTFVTNTPTAPAVRPETLYAYEVGFKSDPSQLVRLNASAYYYNYKDIQTFITNSAGLSFLQNAASARMYGLETSIEVIPARGLQLTTSFGYEHARYRTFPNAQIYIPSPSGGAYSIARDVSGNQVLRTPDLTASGAVSYKFDLAGGGSVTLNGAVSYTGDFFWDSGNLFEQPAYALVDASARYTTANGNYYVSIWGKNLTSHEYSVYRLTQQRYDSVAYGDPLTFGGTIGFKF